VRVVRPADVLVTDEEVTVDMDVPGVTPAWLQTARSGQRRLPRHLGADPARLRPAHERPPGWDGGLYAFIRRVLSTDHAKALYRKRQETIESVFGQVQPTAGPLLMSRKIGRQVGVAAAWRQPQPAQAPPPPDTRRRGLTAPAANPHAAATRPHRRRPTVRLNPLPDSVPGGAPPPLRNENRRAYSGRDGYLQVSVSGGLSRRLGAVRIFVAAGLGRVP
jgi:hypothetical protein